MSASRFVPLVVLLLGLAAPVRAAELGTETSAIRVRGTTGTSPAALGHLRKRIADAALEVCGASPGSLREVKDAVQSTTCWQDSYARGIAQTGGYKP